MFDCKGDGGRYLLRSQPAGSLVVEITDPARTGARKSTRLTSWSEVRTGSVIGQQGGHQSHLRLFDERRSLIFYEGRNGALADTPRLTYAGVVEVSGTDEERTLARCKASTTNRALLETIRTQRKAAGLDPLLEEIANGPFDAWY